jgi:hypothetical protein
MAPIHTEINALRTENNDLRKQLDQLEQYGRRPLIRFSGIPETVGEDNKKSWKLQLLPAYHCKETTLLTLTEWVN